VKSQHHARARSGGGKIRGLSLFSDMMTITSMRLGGCYLENRGKSAECCAAGCLTPSFISDSVTSNLPLLLPVRLQPPVSLHQLSLIRRRTLEPCPQLRLGSNKS
jgi:hypothetical protein